MATWGSGISIIGRQGNAGQRGSLFTITSGLPTDANATTNPGDFALDSTSQLLYTRTSSGWPTSTNAGVLLRGGMGITGTNGATFYSGPSDPTASTTGQDGDLYLQLTTGEIFKHVSGSWSDQGYSIKGPAGTAGAAGLRGSQLYQGSGPPPSDPSTLSPPAQPRDMYFDTTNSLYYVLGA